MGAPTAMSPAGAVGTKVPRLGKAKLPSLGEIRSALPQRVLERNTFISLYYAIRSIGLAAACLAVYLMLRPAAEGSTLVSWAVWGAFAFLQGTIMWGMFTIGHDAGHGSFSAYPALNWPIGLLFHTLLLTPYESWRISHRHHHKFTGNIDRDEIFYPMRQSQERAHVRYAIWSGPLAWFTYLLNGFWPRNVMHFNPWDALFVHYHVTLKVVFSLLAYGGWLLALGALASVRSWAWVAEVYFAPLCVFAGWLVLTTFLHHTEPGVEWYADAKWDYVKGNLSSVDHDYWPFNNIIHNIGTHQIHHLFPSIPHYRLVEATEAFRQAFPHLVRISDKPIISSFLKSVRMYIRDGVISDEATYFRYPAEEDEAEAPHKEHRA